MVEIDVEDLLIGAMEFEKPAVREPYRIGDMILLDDTIESFTSAGVAERLVYRVGNAIEIEDFNLDSSGGEKPVLRSPVNAGGSYEIPLGARPTFPGDNLHLLDFEEDLNHDFDPNIGAGKGLVFVAITARRSIILGTVADSIAGFSGLGLIDFLIFDQYSDRMA